MLHDENNKYLVRGSDDPLELFNFTGTRPDEAARFYLDCSRNGRLMSVPSMQLLRQPVEGGPVRASLGTIMYCQVSVESGDMVVRHGGYGGPYIEYQAASTDSRSWNVWKTLDDLAQSGQDPVRLYAVSVCQLNAAGESCGVYL